MDLAKWISDRENAIRRIHALLESHHVRVEFNITTPDRGCPINLEVPSLPQDDGADALEGAIFLLSIGGNKSKKRI